MINLPYNVARPFIQDADLLQFAGRGIVSRGISVAGRSGYSHSAMAGWQGAKPSLMCYEVREWVGGRITNLSGQVRRFPNRINVYRPCREFTTLRFDGSIGSVVPVVHKLNVAGAVYNMEAFANPGEYGWWCVFRSSLLHLPFIRWFSKINLDDLEESQRPPYCSEAYAFAMRHNFTDVVRETPDGFTLPGDLTRSPVFSYLFTLGPEDYTPWGLEKFSWIKAAEDLIVTTNDVEKNAVGPGNP